MSHDFTISAMNLNIYSRMERAFFVTLFVSMMTYVKTSSTLKILSDEYTTTIAQTYLFTFNSFPQEKLVSNFIGEFKFLIGFIHAFHSLQETLLTKQKAFGKKKMKDRSSYRNHLITQGF